MAKYYEAEERIQHALRFFKKTMKPEAESLKRRIMYMCIGHYGEPGLSPEAAVKKVRTKDLEVYAAMTGFDLDGTIADGVKEFVAKKERDDNLPLRTRANVCKAWFELYEPDGMNTEGFYDKVKKALREKFKHLTFDGGYWPETKQGAFGISIYPNPKSADDYPYDDAAEEIEFALKYVRPHKNGEVQLNVMTEDCSERGIISVVVPWPKHEGVLYVARVEFTRYSRTTKQFEGTLREALRFIIEHHCLGEGY